MATDIRWLGIHQDELRNWRTTARLVRCSIRQLADVESGHKGRDQSLNGLAERCYASVSTAHTNGTDSFSTAARRASIPRRS